MMTSSTAHLSSRGQTSFSSERLELIDLPSTPPMESPNICWIRWLLLFLATMFAQSVFPFHNRLMFLRGIPPQRGASCDSEMGCRGHRHGHCGFESPSSPLRDSRGNRGCGLCADYAHEQPGVCHTDHLPAEDNVEPLHLFELRSVGFGEHPLLR